MSTAPLAVPLSVFLSLAAMGTSRAPATQPTNPPTTNPAEMDEQAFGMLDWKVEENATVLDDPTTVPLGAEVEKYLADRKTVVELLRRSASMPKAYWPEIGGDMKLLSPRLNHSRYCANLLILQSRQDMAQNRPEAAVSDLLAAIALGRHVGADNLIIERLIEWSIESAATNQLALILPDLPKSLLAALPAQLASLPAPTPMAGTFAAEFAFCDKVLTAQGASPALHSTLHGTLALAEPFYVAVGAGTDLPPADFKSLVDAEAAKLPLNICVTAIAPSLPRVIETYAAIRTKRLMLDAAINVQLGAPDALAKSVDPYAKPPAPFALERSAHGFTLTGVATTTNGPVTLRVGP